MSRILLIAGACLALHLSAPSAQAQIYKWVDEDGVVHYADQPQGRDAVRSDIESGRTDTTAARENLAAAITLNEEQNNRLLAPPTDEFSDLDAEQAEELRRLRRESCAAARRKLADFAQARRLYTLDENGAKVYLDEDQTIEARAEAQAAVSEFCG